MTRRSTGLTVWLTGHSGAGKTTLGRALVARLDAEGAEAVLLDAEELRARPGWPEGHDLADRFVVLDLIVDEAAREMARGRVVVVATISHLRSMRDAARARLAPFVEVHVCCSPDVCASRDPKGHWARARRGEYACFVGVTEPYEPSTSPEVTIDTASLDETSAAEALYAAVVRRSSTAGRGAP